MSDAAAPAAAHGGRPDDATLWAWLDEVPDPEIPLLSLTDLGIVRAVCWDGEGDATTLRVTVTPTYSGCPATMAIRADIEAALRRRGIARVVVAVQLAPAWTTDWLTDRGRRRLLEAGIAPPLGPARREHRLGAAATQLPVQCPRCGSMATVLVSRFGATPCQAHFRCEACREPFDHFKCH